MVVYPYLEPPRCRGPGAQCKKHLCNNARGPGFNPWRCLKCNSKSFLKSHSFNSCSRAPPESPSWASRGQPAHEHAQTGFTSLHRPGNPAAPEDGSERVSGAHRHRLLRTRFLRPAPPPAALPGLRLLFSHLPTARLPKWRPTASFPARWKGHMTATGFPAPPPRPAPQRPRPLPLSLGESGPGARARSPGAARGTRARAPPPPPPGHACMHARARPHTPRQAHAPPGVGGPGPGCACACAPPGVVRAPRG